jgi:hypothetical protein
MFNLAIDSKLRGCDLVSLRVRDITHGTRFFLEPWLSRGRRSDQYSSN